jgi:hypothetical protein
MFYTTTFFGNMDASSTRKLYPEGELKQAPLATPLSGPKVVLSNASLERGIDRLPSIVDEIYPSTAIHRRKHESYTLSGSVFLIGGNGQKVKLPAPSDSPADPLSWGQWKRAGVFVAVSWFSIVALAVAQAAGLFLGVISRDFKVDVCSGTCPPSAYVNGVKDILPWQMDTVITIPTLFMGIGAFIWVPLTIGMGRRPVFLFASLLTLLATLGAGYAQTFSQLLACICFLGLGEGFALTAVRYHPFLHH